ncbi:hypothetical protein ZOSMA_35G00010 [Zostera marina]|uniref:ASCH domain-containing protein n=1 Tax=Zostera marina TaxID=29655 RepID=A0A0K9P8G6_ZOSMR|nr:hypothetical protein ZOSMA_35G00010 [Zostera marina]
MSSSSPDPQIPIAISEYMEDFLRFTLTSFLDGTLEVDLPLSKKYCSHLLQEDGDSSQHSHQYQPIQEGSVSATVGVPEYPLYKILEQALGRCISAGDFLRRSSEGMMGIVEDERFKVKEEECKELVVCVGLELLNMVNKDVLFELNVQPPFFSQIKDVLKTVEGRCAVGKYNKIAPGSLILFNKCLLMRVQKVKWYKSFSMMLETETLSKTLPGVATIEEGVQIYRKFYTEEMEKSNGVLAISILRPTFQQPSVLVAKLLAGLNYEGIGSLLGIMHTSGTISDMLPPSRSTLISSFVTPHHTEVRGSFLSIGARALSKHVQRSKDGWWGCLDGNDSKKNKHALKIIYSLLDHCSWMNIEIFFEIRVANGYGARWSKDGLKVFWNHI